jgi:hypothetical protein
MEPNRTYEVKDLRAFAPDLTLEHLQDVMRELWVARQVERAGYGWRRQHSESPSPGANRGDTQRPRSPGARPKLVKPEDLFDHGSFEDMFK